MKLYFCCLLLLLLVSFLGHVTSVNNEDGEDWWWKSVMFRRLVDSRRDHDDSDDYRSRSLPIERKQSSKKANHDPDAFLMQFGYLQKLPQGTGHDPASRTAAIKKFQMFYNLPQTGELDQSTLQAMLHPRCGMPDTQPVVYSQPSDNIPDKRYIPGTRKWQKMDLTYRYKNFASTQRLDIPTQKNAIKRALDVWSAVTPLTFVEVGQGSRGDINIEFAARIHSDGAANQFDGPGGVLAHAYYPESGELHMDDDENWNVDRDTDMMSVAAHELGHALGLPHSNDPEALMAPYYKGYDPDFQLSTDDIQAIQYLYGPNPQPGVTKKPPEPPKPSPTTTTTTTTPRPVVTKPSGEADTCKIAFRAAMQIHDNSIMVFSGHWLWRLTAEYGLDEGFPVLSRTIYPRAPDNVDGAVYSTKTYYTYLFYGRNVWKYYGYEYIEGHVIATQSFAGSILDVITDKDGKIYLVKGSKCWLFDESTTSVVPQPQNCNSLFPNLPMNFNSTIRLDQQPGRIFTFSGPNYFKYNEQTRAVERGYPQPKAGKWMGSVCGGEPGNQK